jgi:hypothetical protein
MKLALWLALVVAVLGMLLYYTPGMSTKGGSEPAVPAVLRADAARLTAMMAGDGVALGALMSDELVFVHSDGRVESKADYVKNMTAGDTAYTNARTSDVQTLKPSSDVVGRLVVYSPALHERLAQRKRPVADGRVAVDEAERQQRGAEEVKRRGLT